MIQIDRASSTSVHDQLLEQLRYRIASGQYQVDETLPSTRKLAEQLGVSFHTVRKVYQELEREGLLASKVGSGYTVTERVPLGKGERMERGAAVVQEALHRLIGLGLDEGEVEYLFNEQMALLEGGAPSHKLLFVAPYQEQAALCAEQVSLVLQQAVEPATRAALDRHPDADFVFTPFPDVRAVMEQLPHADVMGVVTYLRPEILEQVARLLPDATLGLITRHADAIPHLSRELRALTGFGGQMLGASIEERARHLEQVIAATDLLLFTPGCRRRLLTLLPEGTAHGQITPVVSRESLEVIRQSVPS